MNNINHSDLEKRIISDLGLKVSVTIDHLPSGPLINTRPEGFMENHGFIIQTSLAWRTLKSQIDFEPFAGDIIDHINSNPKSKSVFLNCVNEISTSSSRIIELYINGIDQKNIRTDEDWKSIVFSIEDSPIDISIRNEQEHFVSQISQILSAFLIHFEFEEIYEHDIVPNEEGLLEGSRTRIEVNRYERSKINRSICIRHYGCTCQVCEFDFEKTYGNLGLGYIHVHHIVPVSKLGKNYKVDPINDLIPLCPNCHSMIHRNPNVTLTISDLRSSLINDK